MHSPSARALHHHERYCIILVHTLNHLMPGKCVINITYTLLITLSDSFHFFSDWLPLDLTYYTSLGKFNLLYNNYP